jgi:HSP20 family protein
MLARWSNLSDFGFGFDHSLATLDQLRREMDRVFGEYERGGGFHSVAAWPRVELQDTGTALVLRAELPGIKDSDLDLTVNEDTLTLKGERKDAAPEGYSVHRKERGALRFSRSFQLPVKIDSSKAEAKLENGILTLTLPKAAEAQPKRITVNAS